MTQPTQLSFKRLALATSVIMMIAGAHTVSAAPMDKRVKSKSRVTTTVVKERPRSRTVTVSNTTYRDGKRTSRRNINRDLRADRGHYRGNRRGYHAPRYNRRHCTNRNRSPYRSSLGITLNFGSGLHNPYRWAPAAYSYYRPTLGSYHAYQNQTRCERVIVKGWRYSHRQRISVKQCSNPWDGVWYVQGSERLVGRRW